MEYWNCVAVGVGLAAILLVLYFQFAEGTEGMIFYPPHVRVTRTGLKYFDKPYTHDLRSQLDVRILPPGVARAAGAVVARPGVGIIPAIQVPPPSQAQVDAYPAGSGATFEPGSMNEPVSVKVGKTTINGSEEPSESYR